MKKVRKVLIALVIFAIILVVGGITMHRVNEASQINNSKDELKQPVAVGVVSSRWGDVRQWIVAEGTARAVHRQLLNFRTAGKVVFIARDKQGAALREGSGISGPDQSGDKGQLLARIEDKEQLEKMKLDQAELEEANRNLTVSLNDLEKLNLRFSLQKKKRVRAEKLYSKKILSQMDYEAEKLEFSEMIVMQKGAKVKLALAEARIKKTKAQLALAKLELEKTRLYAPFDGIISFINIKKGDYFAPELVNYTSESLKLKTSAIVVSKPDQYEITLDLFVSKGKRINRDQEVYITWGGNYLPDDFDLDENRYHDRFVKGSVYSVTPGINPGGRVIQAKIRTQSGTAQLRDGMPVNCLVVVKEKKNVLVVPKNALVFTNNQPFVFVVNPETGLVSKRKIVKGIEGVKNLEIKSGIGEDEIVVTEGRYVIENDMKVKIL